MNLPFHKISRQTVRNDVIKIWNKEKETLVKIFETLPSKILTSGLWTYPSKGLVIYHANWILHRRIITFFLFE